MTKSNLLQTLNEKMCVCRDCPKLVEHRDKYAYAVVPGEGNPNADVVFLGEAPGEREGQTGRPFVGASGQYLEALLSQVGFSRENAFFTNIVRCRPPKNRDPRQEEADNCRKWFFVEVEKVVQPKFIVCLGRVASLNLLYVRGLKEIWFAKSLESMRGEMHDYKGIPVVCTLHPSALLRDLSKEKFFWQDMKMLREAMNEV